MQLVGKIVTLQIYCEILYYSKKDTQTKYYSKLEC